MVGVYILLAICVVLSGVSAVFGFLAYRSKTNGASLGDMRDMEARIRETVTSTVKLENSMLTGAVNAQIDSVRAVTGRLDAYIGAVNDRLDALGRENNERMNALKISVIQTLSELKDALNQSLAFVVESNSRNLAMLKEDNAKQLEKMRETVDEKLGSTLEKRFNQSFELVNARLEEINRTFTELRSLQSGVNDLNKILKNVKTRGTWGEVALESLLSQILVPEQYDKQVRLTRGSEDAVDFAIRMPGNGDGEVLLPIDAKFPVEDYARIVEASEEGNPERLEAASKALATRLKQEAMSIRDKYIKPPKTTDFAILYLPTEGLYAEAIRREGLVEELQIKYRVIVCGPTTIAALLNSLQLGFRSVAMEKRSAEIANLLKSFTVDFDKFTTLLKRTGDRLGKVQDSLTSAEQRTEVIRKKLEKVMLTGDEIPAPVSDVAELSDVAADDTFDEDD